ncbi:prenyltransferase/squalene oxidase repeat-containing protein [Candidatus Viridilinea mediisalina]|uniref:Squalene cyclase C-terminal domain-containing protein n=1 Tax=Candidatus Viridilinea mediisalina TaxID=2024553 RepID=A0A2A6RPP6_9CHLR|nr:prenyltransferase/squalene oxidase repeat-containing protein [Candidatus Viridilinea mediisalina]PDW04987.1 hypothetical protein CJ255_01005 [Candidatus Viridilinea mediisalina]
MSIRHPLFRSLGSLLLVVLVVSLWFAPVAAQAPVVADEQPWGQSFPFYQDEAIGPAIAYLRTQQLANGGIDSFGFGGADMSGTSRLLLALNAVGHPAAHFRHAEGKGLLDFLADGLENYIYAEGNVDAANLFPGRTGLVLAGVAAAGVNPQAFAGHDLVAALNQSYKPAEGTYSTEATEEFASGSANPVNQSLAIFGLVAAGQPIPEAATQWLIEQQMENGSWVNSVDTTGYALLALLGSGNLAPTAAPIQQAVAFLRERQDRETALWGVGGGGEPANSTGWSINALATYGYTPIESTWATGGTDPRTALRGLQQENGAIAATFVNAFSTIEALFGLTDQPLFMTPIVRAERTLAYLKAQQNDDGGWPGFGADSDVGATLDNIFAFAAAGYHPAEIKSATAQSPLAFLATETLTYTRDLNGTIFPARIGKLIVGLVAAGADPRDFAETDLVAELGDTLQATGAYSSTAAQGWNSGAAGVVAQSFAILGLIAAGAEVPPEALTFLSGLQNEEGSWGSIDETGLVLQALVAAGMPQDHEVITNAVRFLHTSQAPYGGWESFGDFSVNSTAYAIQGLLAAGVDLNSAEWLRNGRSPVGSLASYQKSDGPFVFNWHVNVEDLFNPAADDLFSTQQALPALLGAFYPYHIEEAVELRTSFTPLQRGPDPDRLVAGQPVISLNDERTSASISVPFGSDLDGNGQLTLAWSIVGDTSQPAATTTITPTRGTGVFTATLDLSANPLGAAETLVLAATFSDEMSGVQHGGTLSNEPVVVEARLEPQRFMVYLPLVVR